MSCNQSQRINHSFEDIKTKTEKLLSLSENYLNSDNGNLYSKDFFIIGLLQRTLSTIEGFKLLVESKMMQCSRVILRVQIDTVLTAYSLALVDDIDMYLMKTLKGKRRSEIKDSNGKSMSDNYLIKKLSKEYKQYEWLPKVYSDLSCNVHFSRKAMYSSITGLNDEACTINFSSNEIEFPEYSWFELVECFNKTTDLLVNVL